MGPFPGRLQPQRSDLVSYRHARRLNSDPADPKMVRQERVCFCSVGDEVECHGRNNFKYVIHLYYLYTSSLQFMHLPEFLLGSF